MIKTKSVIFYDNDTQKQNIYVLYTVNFHMTKWISIDDI